MWTWVVAMGFLLMVAALLFGLKGLFVGDKKMLNRSLKWRIGISLALFLCVLLAYSLGGIQVSESIQYL
ncbi:HIG1 domain-containing protein [Candidatus Synchoanobacter obligatus]|uniref:DUF2909 family protein n=1 Tax=Candidatus Synchoanobacter obligatus TaxID=2919597 RepID=A0ABT1L6P6_9GAMM|nr:HIG1 domain-containing protein [Candidatus Synchoanobacter obligatus]MCP8352108.1 DUF2909 family protein [Candidatus Synchoanobacter obligatus]